MVLKQDSSIVSAAGVLFRNNGIVSLSKQQRVDHVIKELGEQRTSLKTGVFL